MHHSQLVFSDVLEDTTSKTFSGDKSQDIHFQLYSYRKTIFPHETQLINKDLQYAIASNSELNFTPALIIQLSKGLHLQRKSDKGQEMLMVETGGHQIVAFKNLRLVNVAFVLKSLPTPVSKHTFLAYIYGTRSPDVNKCVPVDNHPK